MLDFVNPLFAWLALAASIPLIIHLLNRRRYQLVRWAAMDFLLKALHKNRRRLRMESLILLLLRMLIVTVLAFVLAKPYLKGSVLFKEPDTHLVIAIDNSYSMGYRSGMSPIFEEAKKAAAGLMEQLRPEKGDKLSLITISTRPEIIISESSYQMAQAQNKLANLALSDYATDISKTFVLAQEILNKSTSSRKVIYLVTDNQRIMWDNINAIKEKDMLGLVPIKIIQVGPANPANNLISRIYTDKAIITAGSPVTFYAQIRNYSGADHQPGAANVNFFIQGQKYASSTVEIPRNNSVVVSFAHTFNEPGQYWVKIELNSDNLMLDDSRLYPVTVKEGINTLIINGEASPEPSAKSQRSPDYFGEDEILFLRYALSPVRSVQQQGVKSAYDGTNSTGFASNGVSPSPQSSADSFSPYLIDTDTLTGFMDKGEVNLKKPARTDGQSGGYDLVILVNVEFLSYDKVEHLENYVRNGGGLLIFLGDRVNKTVYNESFYKNGAGLLPGQLGGIKGDPMHNETVRFGQVDLTHPALSFFSAIKERFNTLAIYQYYELIEPSPAHNLNLGPPEVEAMCRVLARLNRPDNPALIVEKPFGKGRVMVIGTSADTEWNLMPVRPMYLMLVDRIALYLASFREKALNRDLIVGQPIEMTAESQSVNYTLRLPKKDSISLVPRNMSPEFTQPLHAGAGLYALGSMLRYDTKEVGLYTLSGAGPERFFTANPDLVEGDLRKITSDALKQFIPAVEIISSEGIDFQSNLELVSGIKESSDSSTSPLWRYLLYILLVSVGLEMLLAWRFGRS